MQFLEDARFSRLSVDLFPAAPPLIGPLLELGTEDWIGVNIEGAGTVSDLVASMVVDPVLVEVVVVTVLLLMVLVLSTVTVFFSVSVMVRVMKRPLDEVVV